MPRTAWRHAFASFQRHVPPAAAVFRSEGDGQRSRGAELLDRRQRHPANRYARVPPVFERPTALAGGSVPVAPWRFANGRDRPAYGETALDPLAKATVCLIQYPEINRIN